MSRVITRAATGAIGAATVAAVVLMADACKARPKPPPATTIAWRALGSWSGHGNAQTISFASESGSLRVTWRTHDESAPGAGSFRLTLHSAISGRPLLVAVDAHGTGGDTEYATDDPRVYYAVVESANLDWSFAIAEAVVTLDPTRSGR